MKFIPTLLLSVSLFSAPPEEKVVILGGGVGAMTSALYLSRAGLDPLIIEGAEPGGLITQSHLVENWPGELEIDGTALTEKIRAQVEANGARFLKEEAVQVDFSKRPFKITLRSLSGDKRTREISADTCIIAMGTRPNFLGVPGESLYWGRGISNCATCDGSLYRDRVVGVVGGGDSALLEALYLSQLAKHVHIFVRKASFKTAENRRLESVLVLPNVTVHYQTEVEEIQGNGDLLSGVLIIKAKKLESIPLDGLFLAIGSQPNTEIFKKDLKLDPQGYILLEDGQKTSKEGVYAIGDIADPVYKQAISAAGDGAKAALQAQRFLSEAGSSKPLRSSIEKLSFQIGNQLSHVIEISSAEQFARELDSSLPVVVDFYATWCGPCKRISPLIEQSAEALAGRVKFLKVNVDLFHALSRKYDIRAMPTVLVFNEEGKVTERKVGLDQISALLTELKAANF